MSETLDLRATIYRCEVGTSLGGGWSTAICVACGQRVIVNQTADVRVVHRPIIKLDWTGDAKLESGGDCCIEKSVRELRAEAERVNAEADALEASLGKIVRKAP